MDPWSAAMFAIQVRALTIFGYLSTLSGELSSNVFLSVYELNLRFREKANKPPYLYVETYWSPQLIPNASSKAPSYIYLAMSVRAASSVPITLT